MPFFIVGASPPLHVRACVYVSVYVNLCVGASVSVYTYVCICVIIFVQVHVCVSG